MNSALSIILQLLIFVGVLFLTLYFTAVRGPISRKVRKWTKEGREARKKRLGVDELEKKSLDDIKEVD